MPGADRGENLAACQLSSHVSLVFPGCESNVGFKDDFLLASESASDPRLHYTDAVQGDSRGHAHYPSGVKRDLCRGINHESSVFIEGCCCRMGFHGAVACTMGIVRFFLDEIRLGKSLFHVSE